ncbi:MAG: hypothetical protein KDC42_06010 [Ignavibacteriae bacterium]|nr:hypothetical protein [Ignavibacteriota bacterium]
MINLLLQIVQDTAVQNVTPNTCKVDWDIVWLIVVMIASGIFGGIVNYYITNEESTPIQPTPMQDGNKPVQFVSPKNSLAKCIFIGIGGAFLIPLFLDIVGRTATSNGSTNGGFDAHNIDLLVFAGYCLVASIFARKFMDTISERVLRLAKEAKKEAEKSKEEVEKVKDSVGEKVEEEVAKSNIGASRNLVSDAIPGRFLDSNDEWSELLRLRQNKVRGDRQKNQWGGKSERNGRILTGRVYDKKINEPYYNIVLEVKSVEPEKKPLEGVVIFYLHESFPNNTVIKKVKDGVARLTTYAYGAFTVGAVCDDGRTWLELDLAELEDAPQDFREN